MFKKIAREIPCTEKFLRWLLPRGIVVCLGLVATFIILGYAPRSRTGIVQYKLVTGMSDQQSHVLWLDTDGRAIGIEEDLWSDIGYDSDLKLNQTFEDKARQLFADVHYRISVRLCGTDRIQSFSVSRDVFNAIETNSVIIFETEGLRSDKIRDVVTEPIYSRLVSEPAYPDPDYMRQYMLE